VVKLAVDSVDFGEEQRSGLDDLAASAAQIVGPAGDQIGGIEDADVGFAHQVRAGRASSAVASWP
jgi:hypothetical protein